MGRVSASGQVLMNAVAGPRSAYGFGVAGLGLGRDRPVFALVFGAPLAPNPHNFCH